MEKWRALLLLVLLLVVSTAVAIGLAGNGLRFGYQVWQVVRLHEVLEEQGPLLIHLRVVHCSSCYVTNTISLTKETQAVSRHVVVEHTFATL